VPGNIETAYRYFVFSIPGHSIWRFRNINQRDLRYMAKGKHFSAGEHGFTVAALTAAVGLALSACGSDQAAAVAQPVEQESGAATAQYSLHHGRRPRLLGHPAFGGEIETPNLNALVSDGAFSPTTIRAPSAPSRAPC
jgi:hypothetical protein